MPDYVPERLLERLSESSRDFPVGIDFTSHDAAIAERGERSPLDDRPPRILWNHRWEYDKGPELFFSVLGALRAEGTPFRLVVCGQSFRNRPEVFDVARRELADRIDHFGFFAQYGDYVREAVRCDVVVSTAIHEFFGVATLDAMYCGCLPVLPRRLSYPELIPPHMHPLFLYDKDEDLPDFLRRFLAQPPVEYRAELRRHMARYDWRELAPIFDRELDALP
jgi:glycosyltransferase involved in cell wall biosynthesis